MQSAIVVEKLNSGLTVVVAEQKKAPVVAIQVWVGVGSADEVEAQGGLAHVHEHMLFKGTLRGGPHALGAADDGTGRGKTKRAVGQIAAEIERAGGEINAWTSYDQTVYHVVLASRFFDVGLDVLADAIQRSAFDPGELGRELEVILEEIKRSEDSPQSRVSKALFSTAFHEHPYRRPVIGYDHVVRGFTRDDVLGFFDQHYRAERMTVVIVGDVDARAAIDAVGQAFADVPRGAMPLPPRAKEPEQRGARAKGLVDDVEESHVALGFAGPSLLDPDMPALDVLAVILGQGDSSRLSMSTKRKQQLANEAYAYAYTPRDPGVVVVGASLHHEKLAGAVGSLLSEVRLVTDDKVKAAELDKAKTILASEAVYGKETVEGMARRLGTWMQLTGDPGYEATYQAQVKTVTVDDVQRAARRFFSLDRLNAVALAPRAHADLVDDKRLLELVGDAMSAPRARVRRPVSDVLHERLDNGVTVIIEPDRTNPIVAMRGAWLGGLRAEDDDTSGYTNLCAELVGKGTTKTGAAELLETVDAMAGHIDGFAGRNSFGMRGSFLTQNAERGLELFLECWQDAAFSDEELERARHHVLEELRAKADNPAGLAFEIFGRALWLTHPYRRDLLGTPSTVKAATPDALRRFFARNTQPGQTVLTFVGDVDVDAVLERCAQLPTSQQAPWRPQPPTEAAPGEPRVVRLARERKQAHIVVGVRGLSLSDPDRHALEVLSSALSGQGGRLFLELRDKQSLCYSVSAFSVEGVDPGSFCVYMGTSPDKVDRALAGIDALWAQVEDQGLSDAELDRARRYLIGSHEISLQRLGTRASAMVLNELYGLGHLAHRDAPARIAAVTADDVKRVARRVLGGKRVLSVVGPDGTGGPKATLEVSG